MANQFLDAQTYVNSMLMLVKNRLVLGRNVDASFKDEVTDENGLTTSVKRPPRFTAGTGAALSLQDLSVGRATLAVDQYRNVHCSIGDLESAQSWNALMKNKTMMSASSTLAETIESFLQDKTLSFSNWVGTPGVALQSPQDFNDGWERLEDLSVPGENRIGLVGTRDAKNIFNNLQGTFISGVNRTALEKANIPVMLDIDTFHTQKIASFTSGTLASRTIDIDGASQNVDYADVKNTMTQTLDLSAFTAGDTLKRGDVFTIAGVYAINQRDQSVYDYLQQFTVTADLPATAGLTGTVTISPPIIVPGTGGDAAIQNVNTAFATCSAVPADAAVVTVLGANATTYRANSAFHKSAISMVSARLPMPMTGEASFATDPETGISIRYWRGSDIQTGQHIHRWDTIYGATNLDTLLGTRISGTAV